MIHKGYIAVAVVAVTWGSACASRPKGAEAGEPETVTMEAEGGTSRTALDCKSDVQIEVDPDGSGKKFKPEAPWTLCNDGKLTVTNTLSSAVCLNILDSSGSLYATPGLPASNGKWDNSALPQGDYTLGVCLQKTGSDCSEGCKNLMGSGSAEGPGISDTIKGNLSVVTSG